VRDIDDCQQQHHRQFALQYVVLDVCHIVPPEKQEVLVVSLTLDRDDLARERAREWEHWRIRTRLGDPGRACQAMAFEGRTLSPVMVICR
jgi:hypothetical protein